MANIIFLIGICLLFWVVSLMQGSTWVRKQIGVQSANSNSPCITS